LYQDKKKSKEKHHQSRKLFFGYSQPLEMASFQKMPSLKNIINLNCLFIAGGRCPDPAETQNEHCSHLPCLTTEKI
jgi:hypothetical protein